MQQYIDAYNNNPEVKHKTDEAMQRLLTRSATDLEFRQKLLTDPRGAVSEFTGRALPEAASFRFIENKADATFVLPELVDSTIELSESQLESVAGGSEVGFGLFLLAVAVVAFAEGITSD